MSCMVQNVQSYWPFLPYGANSHSAIFSNELLLSINWFQWVWVLEFCKGLCYCVSESTSVKLWSSGFLSVWQKLHRTCVLWSGVEVLWQVEGREEIRAWSNTVHFCFWWRYSSSSVKYQNRTCEILGSHSGPDAVPCVINIATFRRNVLPRITSHPLKMAVLLCSKTLLNL
jgi:hypothetical protein